VFWAKLAVGSSDAMINTAISADRVFLILLFILFCFRLLSHFAAIVAAFSGYYLLHV
jgi:hypothetical protein